MWRTMSSMVKVAEGEAGGEETGEDKDVGGDVGIGRYLTIRSDEPGKIPQSKISEHGSTP
jgi:hypothetical protein